MEEEEQEQVKKLYAKRLQEIQVELQKKEFLRSILSPEAYERMANVKLSNPKLYENVVNSLAYLVRSGNKIAEKISDEKLYALLARMTGERETTIEFRRK